MRGVRCPFEGPTTRLRRAYPERPMLNWAVTFLVIALIAALLVGLVDTFGKVLLPQFSGMLVYVLMAAVLLYKPEGLFKQ